MAGNEGWMVFRSVGMWIFWILLIVAIVFVVKALSGSQLNPQTQQKGAIEILKMRYARGEIDEQEYERRRRKLEE